MSMGRNGEVEKDQDYWSMKKNYSLIFLWIKYEFILKFIIRDFYIDGKLKNMGNKKKRIFFFIAVTNLIFFRIANV